jgi:hypothetical protein
VQVVLLHLQQIAEMLEVVVIRYLAPLLLQVVALAQMDLFPAHLLQLVVLVVAVQCLTLLEPQETLLLHRHRRAIMAVGD